MVCYGQPDHPTHTGGLECSLCLQVLCSPPRSRRQLPQEEVRPRHQPSPQEAAEEVNSLPVPFSLFMFLVEAVLSALCALPGGSAGSLQPGDQRATRINDSNYFSADARRGEEGTLWQKRGKKSPLPPARALRLGRLLFFTRFRYMQPKVLMKKNSQKMARPCHHRRHGNRRQNPPPPWRRAASIAWPCAPRPWPCAPLWHPAAGRS